MEAINVVFDGPAGWSGRFVEVETDDKKSICVGEWIKRDDGLWSLRITQADFDGLKMKSPNRCSAVAQKSIPGTEIKCAGNPIWCGAQYAHRGVDYCDLPFHKCTGQRI